MNKEAIQEMIECQGVYEIQYLKDEEIKTRHISDIRYSPIYGDSYIICFCEEADKELTFKIEKIVYIKSLWIGIMSKDDIAPKDGVYLIACGGLGQGIDIEYELHILIKGDTFRGKHSTWAKPIAYQYIPMFDETEGNWIRKEIIIKKGEKEEVLAPEDGIPIIAFRRTQNESSAIEYCVRKVDGQETIWGGIRKDDDVLRGFKDYEYWDSYGFSESWDEYQILGFTILREYNKEVCYRHVDQRLKTEPRFLFD